MVKNTHSMDLSISDDESNQSTRNTFTVRVDGVHVFVAFIHFDRFFLPTVLTLAGFFSRLLRSPVLSTNLSVHQQQQIERKKKHPE